MASFWKSRVRWWIVIALVIGAVPTFLLIPSAEERALVGDWHLYSENSDGELSYTCTDYRFSWRYRFSTRSTTFRDGRFVYDPFNPSSARWTIVDGELILTSPQSIGTWWDRLQRWILRKPATVPLDRPWGRLTMLSPNEFQLSGANYRFVRVNASSDTPPEPNRAIFGE